MSHNDKKNQRKSEWDKCCSHQSAAERAKFLREASDQQIRLMFGEMTEQEMRTLRAGLNYISPPPQQNHLQ